MNESLTKQLYSLIFNITIIIFHTLALNKANGVDAATNGNKIKTKSVESVNSNKFPTIRPSLFPYVPPYINFCTPDENCKPYPIKNKEFMKWNFRIKPEIPKYVRSIVTNSGFLIVNKSENWTGRFGYQIRGQLMNYQKLSYLPCKYNLGRKDALWLNFKNFKNKFGIKEFGFMPHTYILPRQQALLKSVWNKTIYNHWIVKPAALARGRGIRLVNEWTQIPKKNYIVVQKYIRNPFLISNTKFDIRLYAIVSSLNPLKIYMYTEGVLRFAARKYSNDTDQAHKRCVHLTNNSIMKECGTNSARSKKEVFDKKDRTFKELWRYLNASGHNTEKIWNSIEDIVIKTMIVVRNRMVNCNFKLPSRYNGYGLYGFDIMLDENLKPWLLEVNPEPSLIPYFKEHIKLKSEMVKEFLNIVGYHFPNQLPEDEQKILKGGVKINKTVKIKKSVFDERLYCSSMSPREILKHNFAKKKYMTRKHYLSKIINKLTPDDIRYLIQAEDELSQCKGFKRVFPSDNSHKYMKFMDSPRYYDQLLDAWEFEYGKNRSVGIERLQRLCRNKQHLKCVNEII